MAGVVSGATPTAAAPDPLAALSTSIRSSSAMSKEGGGLWAYRHTHTHQQPQSWRPSLGTLRMPIHAECD
eukprot:6988399-Alexandrium_andersonii.AAC.1